MKAQELQSWPADGAEWSYCINNVFPYYTLTHTFGYVGDTVINTLSYAVVEPIALNGMPIDECEVNNSFGLCEVEDLTTFYRQSGDTIYRWVNDKDYIFMINGISIGESYTAFRSSPFNFTEYPCTPELVLEIIAAEMVMVNGTSYREVTLRDSLAMAQVGQDILYRYIEGVGLRDYFPFFSSSFYTGESDSEDLWDCWVVDLGESGGSLYNYIDDALALDYFQCEVNVSVP